MIAKRSGRIAAPLVTSREHDNREFLGQPCPFLVDNACSVYDVRPLVCRSHFSFDATAHWCAPERSTTVQMKLLRFSGARRAYDGVVGDGRRQSRQTSAISSRRAGACAPLRLSPPWTPGYGFSARPATNTWARSPISVKVDLSGFLPFDGDRCGAVQRSITA